MKLEILMPLSAFENLFEKIRPKRASYINRFIFQSKTPAYVPGLTVTLNENSFFRKIG